MNCLFFTTVFNVFTTDFHFFTTPPSILTTPPSILTTLLCSLRSEICCYLGLGRHAAHKIKISGDALTVSAPNICPSTTTVGTPYVRVICTGAASQSACPVVTAGIWVSGPAAGPSGVAKHRIKIITIHGLYTWRCRQWFCLWREGWRWWRRGRSFRQFERGRAFCRWIGDDEVPILPFKIANRGCWIHV
jgi:hypothetical protein